MMEILKQKYIKHLRGSRIFQTFALIQAFLLIYRFYLKFTIRFDYLCSERRRQPMAQLKNSIMYFKP